MCSIPIEKSQAVKILCYYECKFELIYKGCFILKNKFIFGEFGLHCKWSTNESSWKRWYFQSLYI